MAKVSMKCKEHMVKELFERFSQNPNLFITTFSGLTVLDIEKLRYSLRNVSSKYIVVKDSIVKKVFQQLKLGNLITLIDGNGSTGISFGTKDFIATSKVLVNFTRDHQNFAIRSGFLDGQILLSDSVKELASLPSRDILYAWVLYGMKSPITNFVSGLINTLRKFVYVLNRICEKRNNEMKPQLME